MAFPMMMKTSSILKNIQIHLNTRETCNTDFKEVQFLRHNNSVLNTGRAEATDRIAAEGEHFFQSIKRNTFDTVTSSTRRRSNCPFLQVSFHFDHCHYPALKEHVIWRFTQGLPPGCTNAPPEEYCHLACGFTYFAFTFSVLIIDKQKYSIYKGLQTMASNLLCMRVRAYV